MLVFVTAIYCVFQHAYSVFSHSALWPPGHLATLQGRPRLCISPFAISTPFNQSWTIVALGRISGIVLLHKQHLSPLRMMCGNAHQGRYASTLSLLSLPPRCDAERRCQKHAVFSTFVNLTSVRMS